MNEYENIIEKEMQYATKRVKSFLPTVESLSVPTMKEILGVYTLAIQHNFLPWMILAEQTARNEISKEYLDKNINDEINQNHPEMLASFAKNCDANLTKANQIRAVNSARPLWQIFSGQDDLSKIAIIAALEGTSPIFIPYLATIGLHLGCEDFTYTDVHGEADLAHAKQMRIALSIEMEHYTRKNNREVMATTIKFLEGILTG